jgi:hypothetical protein
MADEVPVDAESPTDPKRQSKEEYPLAIVDLFDTEGKQAIISWALDDAQRDRWHYKTEIRDGAGVSRETVRKYADDLVAYGILAVRGETKKRYRPATDSETFQLLDDWDHYPLGDLLKTRVRRRLVDYVTTEMVASARLPITEIGKQSRTQNSVYENFPILVEAGLVEQYEPARPQEDARYGPAPDSPIWSALATLNNTLVETYRANT